MATVRPPIGLPEPGLTLAVVIPPASASSNPMSAGLMASNARTDAVTGSVSSLVSLPAQPSALLVHAEVRVRVDEAGQQPAAAGVQHRGLGGTVDVGSHGGDPPVVQQHGAVERVAVDRGRRGLR